MIGISIPDIVGIICFAFSVLVIPIECSFNNYLKSYLSIKSSNSIQLQVALCQYFYTESQGSFCLRNAGTHARAFLTDRFDDLYRKVESVCRFDD